MSDDADLDWYQGQAPSGGGVTIHRPFIYHIRKTGGTTLFSTLRWAYDSMLRSLVQAGHKLPPLTIGRYDTEQDITPETLNNDFVLVASHLPYPSHRRFRNDFKLVTIVRDPFKRALSSFTYRAMRAGEEPTQKSFEAFLADEENLNVQAKVLSGLPLDSQATTEDAGQRAWTILDQEFSYFGTTEHIHAITSCLLQQSSLPNVLAERMNRTHTAYQFDAEPFREHVLTANCEDVKLFNAVTNAPRTGTVTASPGQPHEMTVVLYETAESSDAQFKASGGIIPTAQILPHIKDGKMPRAAFEKLLASATQGS